MAKPSLIKPPSRLSDKVAKTGGLSPEQAIFRALGAVEGLMEGYQGWAVDDLQNLWQAFQDTAAGKGAVTEMYEIAHQVRGQGGTFGFQLISQIGDSLCRFLGEKKKLSKGDLEIIKIHILAMKAVFRQDLKGGGGALGDELPALLLALRDRAGRKRR